jgi:hypothetical protein
LSAQSAAAAAASPGRPANRAAIVRWKWAPGVVAGQSAVQAGERQEGARRDLGIGEHGALLRSACEHFVGSVKSGRFGVSEEPAVQPDCRVAEVVVAGGVENALARRVRAGQLRWR